MVRAIEPMRTPVLHLCPSMSCSKALAPGLEKDHHQQESVHKSLHIINKNPLAHLNRMSCIADVLC